MQGGRLLACAIALGPEGVVEYDEYADYSYGQPGIRQVVVILLNLAEECIKWHSLGQPPSEKRKNGVPHQSTKRSVETE